MDWDAEVTTWVEDGLISPEQKQPIVGRLVSRAPTPSSGAGSGQFGRHFWAEFVSSVAFVVGVSILFLALIFLLHQVIPDSILNLDQASPDYDQSISDLHLIDALIYFTLAVCFIVGGWFVRSKGWFSSITNACYFISVIVVQVAIIFLYIALSEKDIISAGADVMSDLVGTVFVVLTIGAGAFGLWWGWRSGSYAVAGVGAASLVFSVPMSLFGYLDIDIQLSMDLMAVLSVGAALGLVLQRKFEERDGFVPADLVFLIIGIAGFAFLWIADQFLLGDNDYILEKTMLQFAYGGALLAMAAPWRNIPGMIISAFVLVIAVNAFGFEYGDVIGGVMTMCLSGIAIIGVGVWAILNLVLRKPKDGTAATTGADETQPAPPTDLPPPDQPEE